MSTEKKKDTPPSMSEALQAVKENVIFVGEALREFQATGSYFPTSRWAAQVLIEPLRARDPNTPLRILELGPGTGAVTVHILPLLKPQDEFAICEINPRFLKALKDRLNVMDDYKKHKDRIQFFGCAMQDLPEDGPPFDIIVCAIPFLNLDVDTVREIFSKLRRLSNEKTVMTYYEYIGLRSIGKVVSPPKHRARLKQIDSFFHTLFSAHLVQRAQVYMNVLPINVYVLKALHQLPVPA